MHIHAPVWLFDQQRAMSFLLLQGKYTCMWQKGRKYDISDLSSLQTIRNRRAFVQVLELIPNKSKCIFNTVKFEIVSPLTSVGKNQLYILHVLLSAVKTLVSKSCIVKSFWFRIYR